jgi:hypothetical protein
MGSAENSILLVILRSCEGPTRHSNRSAGGWTPSIVVCSYRGDEEIVFQDTSIIATNFKPRGCVKKVGASRRTSTFPENGAVATGRRNTGMEFTSRSIKVQSFPVNLEIAALTIQLVQNIGMATLLRRQADGPQITGRDRVLLQTLQFDEPEVSLWPGPQIARQSIVLL